MNRFEFYLRSFVSTVGHGLNLVIHRGQYAVSNRVVYYKGPVSKVFRNNGRNGRG